MGKAIIAATITLVLGVLMEAYLGVGDYQGIGMISSVAIMGGFIIYFDKKKK